MCMWYVGDHLCAAAHMESGGNWEHLLFPSTIWTCGIGVVRVNKYLYQLLHLTYLQNVFICLLLLLFRQRLILYRRLTWK